MKYMHYKDLELHAIIWILDNKIGLTQSLKMKIVYVLYIGILIRFIWSLEGIFSWLLKDQDIDTQ